MYEYTSRIVGKEPRAQRFKIKKKKENVKIPMNYKESWARN